MTKAEAELILQKYLPVAAVPTIAYWIFENQIHLKITHSRKSKFGDYTPPHSQKGHTISVNGDLNPFAFMITLIHELAHLNVWERYKNNVHSHGEEWKGEFRYLMNFFVGKNIFPKEIETALLNYLQKTKSSTCFDVDLMKALNKHSEKGNNMIYIEDLEENSFFKTENGRVFQKIKKVRKRFQCVETITERIFLFSPIAEVQKI